MTPRTALITGGTRGIGLGIARALVRDGWSVALSGRRAPGGGIERLRNFTTTFSQVSDELNTCSVSRLSSVRLPVFRRWL